MYSYWMYEIQTVISFLCISSERLCSAFWSGIQHSPSVINLSIHISADGKMWLVISHIRFNHFSDFSFISENCLSCLLEFYLWGWGRGWEGEWAGEMGEELKAFVGRGIRSWSFCSLQPPLRCNCLVFGPAALLCYGNQGRAVDSSLCHTDCSFWWDPLLVATEPLLIHHPSFCLAATPGSLGNLREISLSLWI